MTTSTSVDRNREKRLRRLADKQGYRLHKLRSGNGYWLLDLDTNGLIIGEQVTAGVCIGYDLAVIQNWLTGIEAKTARRQRNPAYAAFCDYLQYDLENGVFDDEDETDSKETR